MEKKINFVPMAAILGISLIVAAGLVAGTIYKIKALDNTLVVTGSAKTKVTSDLAKWSMRFSRTVPVSDLKRGYADMERDLGVVKAFFKNNGIEESALVISPVFADKNYYYEKTGSGVQEYMLQQTVEVQSKDVAKIKALAANTKYIVDNGVIFSPQSPEYYYTKLSDLRIELLGEAVKDAKMRAGKIAESGGQMVGSLRSTSVGVTQVTAVNSIDAISDYGAYDTSTEEKEVMVTVRAVFGIR